MRDLMTLVHREETSGGSQTGSLSSLPPDLLEQIRGRVRILALFLMIGFAIDIRTDIYSVGCVSYWLLTGQLLFNADTAMGFLLHHAKTEPTAPSTKSEVPIPAALDELVLSCLAKDPGGRPQTAQDLSLRLSAIQGVAPWTEERAREWWVRHRPPGNGGLISERLVMVGQA